MLHVLAPYVWPVVPLQLLALSPAQKYLYTEQRIPDLRKQLEIVFGEKTGQTVLRKNWTWVYNCTDQQHFYMDSAPYPSIFLSLFFSRSPKSFLPLLFRSRQPMKILCNFKILFLGSQSKLHIPKSSKALYVKGVPFHQVIVMSFTFRL